MSNLSGPGHASKSRLLLELLEDRLVPALSIVSSIGPAGSISVPHPADHVVNDLLAGTSDVLSTQVSEGSLSIKLLRASQSAATAMELTSKLSAQSLIGTVANDSTGLASTGRAIVPMATGTAALLKQLNGSNVVTAGPSLLKSMGTAVGSHAMQATSPSSVGQIPEEKDTSLNGPSIGQPRLEDAATWDGGSDGAWQVPPTALSYAEAAESGNRPNAGGDSVTGMADEADLQPETLPMTAALVMNRLEAAASAAAKQLADSLNTELGWLSTIDPSVWLICALFVFMSHEYLTRRKTKPFWPDAGTPWSSALADVVSAR
jgi:hypothetical protein